MKERQILSNGEMVRAILDGRKTQTRRVINPQPDYSILKDGVELEAHKCPQLTVVHLGRKEWGLYGKPYNPSAVPCFAFNCPYGQPGDLLYCRETWCNAETVGFDARENGGEYWYRATDEGQCMGPWKPSIFMPKAAARLWLTVTDIRVERVGDISEDDARAEGTARWDHPHCTCWRDNFRLLWDSINAKRGYPFAANNWVWKMVFEKVER